MMEVLRHRGPDAEGLLVQGPLGIGHRRLSIIDLVGSHQPMQTPDGRFTLTFNGEIFNYQQLRRDEDYPYRTNGDTEVVLSTISRHGPHAASRFVGQFAFAMHDREASETWLVRDRVGVLPLYYYLDGQRLIFGSEIKAVLVALGDSVRLDEAQLRGYLKSRVVHAPNTLFASVKKVPPGHIVRIDKHGTASVERYWALPQAGDVLHLPVEDAVNLVEDTLVQAIEASLVADVPVGAYLSGGVDSSLIVALTKAARTRAGSLEPIKTFAAEFGDERVDETVYSQLVAKALGTDHHRVLVRPESFHAEWERLTWHRDAPVSEPADIAVAQLARAASEHVKVVLSGEGSDELFGGYPKYRYARATRAANLVPNGLRTGVLRRVERSLPAGRAKARIALRALSGADRAHMDDWFASFTDYECDLLLGASTARPLRERAHRDAIDLMARLDLETWLADNLLERGDRMSMASSLELRPPFLDHRLVECAFRLPSSLKVRNGHTKWIIKEVATRHLPAEVVWRPKVGFKVPLDAWFRRDLEALSRDLLLASDSFVSSLVDTNAVSRLIDDHTRHRRDEEIRIWTLLSLEIWGRQFFGSVAPLPH